MPERRADLSDGGETGLAGGDGQPCRIRHDPADRPRRHIPAFLTARANGPFRSARGIAQGGQRLPHAEPFVPLCLCGVIPLAVVPRILAPQSESVTDIQESLTAAR